MDELAQFPDYNTWLEQEYYGLQKVKINDSALAKELELKSRNNGGNLTTAEFLTSVLYGPAGYHSIHETHGKTDIHQRWSEALARLCIKYGLNTIVEFGPGDGDLGIATIKASKRTDKDLKWYGVETNPRLRDLIIEKFCAEKLNSNLGGVCKHITELPRNFDKALVVFPYSLDSIPPECFSVTTKEFGFPDSIIGLSVKDGILEEYYLTDPSVLKAKGIELKDGIYRFGDQAYDISDWRLHKGQRAYPPSGIARVLTGVAKAVPVGSRFIIIDEYIPKPLNLTKDHLAPPRDLNGARKLNPRDLYANLGNRLMYFPTYFESLESILLSCGLRIELSGGDEKLSNEIVGKPYIRDFRFIERRFATVTSHKSEANVSDMVRIAKPVTYCINI